MITTIKITSDNHKLLTQIKKEQNLTSFDEAITYLLEVENKYKHSKIVRLIE